MSGSESKGSTSARGRIGQTVTLVLVACVISLWFLELSHMWKVLPDYRFGYLVPVLFLIIIHEKWRELPCNLICTASKRVAACVCVGFACTITAGLYHQAVGRTPSSVFIFSIGCYSFCLGLLLAGCGVPATSILAGPIGFIFFAVPLPRLIWNPLVMGLQKLVVVANTELLSLAGIPAKPIGNSIILANSSVFVDEACGGFRSLQSSAMAGAFLSAIFLSSTGGKILFCAVGCLLAVAGNISRSVILCLISEQQITSHAFASLHDYAGWGVLLLTTLGLLVLLKAVKKLEACSVAVRNSTQQI